MRILLPTKVARAKLTPHQRVFLEFWYSMTHMQSLDSFRVRCMNSRTILREFSEEMRIRRIEEGDFGNLCHEAAAILDSDPVIQRDFQSYWSAIKTYLESPPPFSAKAPGSRKGDNPENGKKDLQLVARDFLSALEKTYFEKLMARIPEAIESGNDNEIKMLVDALLSDLIDRGWPLETLFGWHRHFLARKPKSYTFSENLAFMFKIFRGQPYKQRVILRLQGGNNLEQLGQYGQFTFLNSVELQNDQHKLRKRFQHSQGISFAEITTEGVDSLSAAIAAREKFEELADLLRFDLEASKLRIDSLCYVENLTSGKGDFPVVQASIPNPTGKYGHDEFVTFARDLDSISDDHRFDENSRSQLRASIRQYRFGRDSENYKDKFLNWWMGLEALGRGEQGRGIGETVAFNISRAMAVPYLRRLVDDMVNTLKYCKINWPARLEEASGCSRLDQLTADHLVTILQSEERQALWDQCADHPTLQLRGQEIADFLSEPQRTALRLKNHLQHLEWHLARLYRIRCCIVHGSPVRFRLGLLTANLEYYLKQVILLVISTFKNNGHVEGLTDFFERAAFACKQVMEELESPNSGPDSVRSAVFRDFVL